MASAAAVSGTARCCVSLRSSQTQCNVSARKWSSKPTMLIAKRPCLSSSQTLAGTPLLSSITASKRARSSPSRATTAAVAEGETAVEEEVVAAEEQAEEVPAEETSSEADAGVKPARRPFKNRRKITVKVEDLTPGQVLPGKVRSIQSYGCFVDIGAFTDGLIHISELADQFVENVGDLVEVGQEVQARVLEVDSTKGRISLSLRTPREERPEAAEGSDAPRAERSAPRRQGGDQRPRKASAGGRGGDKPSHGIRKGQKFEGTVTNIAPFGAFLELKEGVEGLLHASEIGESSNRVEVSEHLEVGQKVQVTVIAVTKDRISLSTKEKVDTDDINTRLNQENQVGTDGITNPFEAAFKKSNMVFDTLPGADELAKTKKPEPVAEASDEIKTETEQIKKGGLFADKKGDDAPAAEAEQADEPAEEGTGAAEAATAVQEKAKEVVDDVKEAAEPVVNDVTESDVGGKAEEVVEDVKEAAEPVVDDVKESAQAISEGVEPIADVAKDAAEPVVKDVTESAQAVSEGVEPVVDVADTAVENVKEAAEPAVEAVQEVAEDVKEAAEPAVEAVSETVEPVTDAAETVVDKAQDAAEPAVEAVQDVVEDVKEAAEPVVEKVEDVVDSKPVQDVVENAKEAAEPVVERVEDVIESEPVQGVVENVKKAAEPVIDRVEDVIDSVKEAILPAAEETEEAAEKTKEAAEKTKEAAEEAKEKALPAVESAAPAGEEKEDAPSLAEQVKEAADEGMSALEGVTDKVMAAADEVINGGEEKPAEKEEPKKEEPKKEESKKEAGGISASLVKALREETGSGMMDCKKALAEAGGDLDKARDLLRKKGLASADKKSARVAAEGSIGSYIHDSRIGVLLELNCETDFVSRGDTFKELLDDLAMQVAACPQVEFVSVDEVPADLVAKEREIEAGKEDLASKPEAIREKMVDGRINKRLGELALLEQPFIKDDKLKVKDLVKQTVAKIGENIQVRRFARFNLGEGLEKKTSNLAAEVAEQTKKKEAPPAEAPKKEEAPASAEEAKPTVAVSAGAVKELRAETGAGMMDCKKALAECNNDVEKARELLRKKGLASAEKKSSRLAAEGAIGSYIHDGRIGVLVEVNCETDFVARGEKFKELVEDVAMQVAACPQVTVVSPDDVPADIVAKEREIELGKEDLASKPEAMREKIVDGRMAKRVNELALLEQPYIRDDKQKLKDVIKAAVAQIGENIQVRRFERFNLGEGIEKRSVDFAAEVAAQTGKA